MTQPTLSPADAARLARQLRALSDWYRIGPETAAMLREAAGALDAAHAEIARLNEWADGFSDAQLKERRTGEEYIRELQAELARLRAPVQANKETCDHAGWNFKEHGRCCFKCGAFMVDWGD